MKGTVERDFIYGVASETDTETVATCDIDSDYEGSIDTIKS